MLRGLPLGVPFLADNGLEPLLHLKFWRDLRAHGRALGPLRDQAFAAFSERGGYPIMHARPDLSWEEMADQLDEGVIERIKQHERAPLDPPAIEKLEELPEAAQHLAECVVAESLRTLSVLDILKPSVPGQEPKIDFVLSIGLQRIPIEVKYQSRPDPVRDTAGLRAFLDKPANRAPFGLLITRQDDDVDYGERVVALPLSSFLLLR